MTLFETLDEIGNLCRNHNIHFEVDECGIIIRKYFDYGGKVRSFNQAFSFEVFKYRSLQDYVLEFERRLEIELDKLKSEEEQ